MTDSDGEIRYSEEKPGVSNLLSIYAAICHIEPEQAEKEFAGKGYGTLKDAVADAIVGELEPLQKRFLEIRSDKQLINSIVQSSAERAQKVANKTLWKVQKKVGFGPKILRDGFRKSGFAALLAKGKVYCLSGRATI